MDEALKGCTTEKQIKQAIMKAFARLEAEWTDFAKEGYERGYPKVALVGSCALITLVVGDRLYVANLGDSKACLLRENPDDSTQFEQVPLSVTHNANKS